MSNNALIFGSSWVTRLGVKQVLRRIGLNVQADGDDFKSLSKHMVAQAPTLVIGLAVPPYERNRLAADMRVSRATYPDVPHVLICSMLTAEAFDDAMCAGSDGLLGLNMPSKLLLSSIELIVHGQKLYPGFPQLAAADMNEPVWSAKPSHASGCTSTEQLTFAPAQLTSSLPSRPASGGHGLAPSEREWEILDCLALGGSNKAIARELGIAETTVKVHVKSVLRKLHLSNRTQAAVWMQSHQQPVNATRRYATR